MRRPLNDVILRAQAFVARHGAIGPASRRAARFGSFGEGSVICFPFTTLYGERWMRVGAHTILGPRLTLSAGLSPTQAIVNDPAVVIGDRCSIGAGSGIVSHHSIEIGDDVWTGHNVYITDANHGYEDVTEVIGRQLQPARPVSIGDGSWLGHGAIVLPGAQIGRHCVVAAGSVVTGVVPDRTVVAGAPARAIRRWIASPSGGPDDGTWEWLTAR